MTDITFAQLAEIFDADWTIVTWKGFSPNKDKQTVTLEIVRKGKSVSQVYREGIAGHSHANWMIEGGYVDSDIQ